MRAVFVDLDRTLLCEASGPVLAAALAAEGLSGAGRRLPGDTLWWSFYNRFGETTLSMAVARAAASAARGWDVERAMAAAEAAVEPMLQLMAPGAPAALRAWRDEGARIVIATTTPEHLVAPFAKAIGADAVVATRYEQRDGAFTGGLEGGFCWGTGKLAMIRAYCAEEDIDLAECAAVSDSVFDVPLLRAVGHPLVVNPDPRLSAVAMALRWPRAHWSVAGGVPSVAGVEPLGLLAPLLRPQLFPYARFEITGIEHIPATGPVVIAANHRSYFDVAALAILAARIHRPVRALAKRELFELPLVAELLRALGGLPVDRGHSGAAAFAEAVGSLRRGEVVFVLPQGTIPRGERFFDPVLVGHTGAVRLAQESGAVVVPVGVWGTEHVWPRSARLPNVTTLTSPRAVSITIGEPVRFTGTDPRMQTEELMRAITMLLPDEARERRTPTDEELARTYPPGRAPGADA
jgi:putative phosphoserine phosphatase/1-acylglycerol-3-phosphate O-acyltransferase